MGLNARIQFQEKQLVRSAGLWGLTRAMGNNRCLGMMVPGKYVTIGTGGAAKILRIDKLRTSRLACHAEIGYTQTGGVLGTTHVFDLDIYDFATSAWLANDEFIVSGGVGTAYYNVWFYVEVPVAYKGNSLLAIFSGHDDTATSNVGKFANVIMYEWSDTVSSGAGANMGIFTEDGL